ncbi:MAG TPA: amidohydrolase family protein [Mycobacteriales bacterium]|nr:amidohydrolase family protein [Mycobacteriales bacterium]
MTGPTAPQSYHERDAAGSAALLARLRAAAPATPVLLRGATVVTVDPAVPDLPAGDVLIRGDTIEAVGVDLADRAGPGAIAVDLAGMILLPGFVDGHRHCWQNQLRHLLCDAGIDEYIAMTHGSTALHYRPADMFAGDLVTLAGALDAGFTTVLDFSHNSRSRAHSDAVFAAYQEAGIRVVHTSAPPNAGQWEEQFPADLPRLRETYCPDGGLTTLRMGIDLRRVLPPAELVRIARGYGLGITFDGVMGPPSSAEVAELGRQGVLGPDVTLVHATDMSDPAWRYIADAGTRITLAPTSDEQLGLADGVPPVQKALDFGIRPSLSVDVEISLSNDMFTQMRCVLLTQRMQATQRRYRHDPTAPEFICTADVLEFATARGADAVGLGAVTGTLTPGKQADIVAIRAEDVNNLPLNNAVATIVQGADTRNIDTVIVGGSIRKWAGELVGLDLVRLRTLAYESRDYLAARAGFAITPTQPVPRLQIQDPYLRDYFASRGQA